MFRDFPTGKEGLVIAGVALAVYVVLIAGAQAMRRRRNLSFGWTYHLFALFSGILSGLLVSGWHSELFFLTLPHLTGLVLLLAAFPAVVVVNYVLWTRPGRIKHGEEVPRVLIDLTGFAVIAATLLIVLQFIYDVKVPGLVAGSGVIAIILGLAMQDLLGNLIAGINLHFEKSFTTGDWLLIDGTHARVIELSWRSTQLLTMDDVLIDIPNSHIAKQPIQNFEKPTRRHAVRATIGLHYDAPPAQVEALLKRAAASVEGVCAEPAPVIYLKDFADSAIVYEIKVWIEDHGKTGRILSEVRSHCWYAVKRAGIEIPYPQLTLHRAQSGTPNAALRASAARALKDHSVFGFLGVDQVESLVDSSPTVMFAAGEAVIKQREAGSSMFLIIVGNVEVLIDRDGKSLSVARLNAGDCIGEMSMLTGEPRTATVIASNEVTAVEITKENFGRLVRDHPDILVQLSAILAQRQLANEKITSSVAQNSRIEEAQKTVMRRLKIFFQLGA